MRGAVTGVAVPGKQKGRYRGGYTKRREGVNMYMLKQICKILGDALDILGICFNILVIFGSIFYFGRA